LLCCAPGSVSGLRRRWILWFFATRGLDSCLGGADENMRIAAFHPRHGLHRAVSGEVRAEAHEQFLAEIGVRDLTPAELHHGLDPVPFLQKADGVVLLEVVV